MAEFLRIHWKYLFGAFVVHALFAGVLALTALSLPRDPVQPQLAIQAVVVDPSAVSRGTRQQQEERERAAAREREAQAVERRRQQEEQARREAETRAEQERQLEVQRREEQQLREQQEQQRQREVEQERQRQADLQKQREAEQEKRRQAEAEKKRQAEAERKRVEEIERRQKEEAEKRRAAEEARQRAAREEELRRQIAEEEGLMEARTSSAMSSYVALIQQHVERRWIRPPSARSGIECEVRVAQGPSGVVLSVTVGTCNGDQAVRQSIETAVQRASPLPLPADPRLFERNLRFIFKPAD